MTITRRKKSQGGQSAGEQGPAALKTENPGAFPDAKAIRPRYPANNPILLFSRRPRCHSKPR